MVRILSALAALGCAAGCLDTPDAAPDPCPENRVDNGGFEDGTSGWFSYSGDLTWGEHGRTGARSALVCWNGFDATSYNVQLRPSYAVRADDRGVELHLDAWVRSASPDEHRVYGRMVETDADDELVQESAASVTSPTTGNDSRRPRSSRRRPRR